MPATGTESEMDSDTSVALGLAAFGLHVEIDADADAPDEQKRDGFHPIPIGWTPQNAGTKNPPQRTGGN